MPTVQVVTDSAADILPATAASLGIAVVPLSIHFGEQTYFDGETLSPTEFYQILATNPNFPRTSQPSVGRFEEVYKQARDAGAEVISIHLSSALSGTYNAATLAARSVEGAAVRLVDSKIISMAQGDLAIAAARFAADGKSAAWIAERIEAMLPLAHVDIMLDSLTHLQRGGRIGRAQSLFGTLLSIKPIIALGNGEVVPRARVRTASRALEEMANEAGKLAPLADIVILHSNAPKYVKEFQQRLQPLLPGKEIPVQLLGPVVGTHVGGGAIGVVLLQEQPA